MHTIVVLADGETWTMIDGCSICVISDEQLAMISDDGLDPRDLIPMVELGLRDNTTRAGWSFDFSASGGTD